MFIPLEQDEALRVTLHLSVRPRPVVVSVKVNGESAGRFLASPGFTDYELPAPTQFRGGTNELTRRKVRFCFWTDWSLIC